MSAAPSVSAVINSLHGDCRTEERYPYRHVQRLAIMDGPRWPHSSEFFPIECQDISRSGIGFFSTADLSGRTVLVALGRAPQMLMYVVAQVIVCTPVTGDSQQRNLVGCRFVKRIPYHEDDAAKASPNSWE